MAGASTAAPLVKRGVRAEVTGLRSEEISLRSGDEPGAPVASMLVVTVAESATADPPPDTRRALRSTDRVAAVGTDGRGEDMCVAGAAPVGEGEATLCTAAAVARPRLVPRDTPEPVVSTAPSRSEAPVDLVLLPFTDDADLRC